MKLESPKSRHEEIRQRIGATHMRTDELQAQRHSDATSVTVSERLASAQRHLAAAQAGAEQAIAAAVRAFRRAAEAHERVALLYERVAAADCRDRDRDEHERQAAIHRSAAMADTERAEYALSVLGQDTGPSILATPADSNGDSNSSDHRPHQQRQQRMTPARYAPAGDMSGLKRKAGTSALRWIGRAKRIPELPSTANDRVSRALPPARQLAARRGG